VQIECVCVCVCVNLTNCTTKSNDNMQVSFGHCISSAASYVVCRTMLSVALFIVFRARS
jgi:hypothetical protein